MATNSVFIGLVSHSKSFFSQSQGPSGLSAQLAQSFSDFGVSCQVRVNTGNLFDENALSLTPAMARASVREELRLESAWFRFLQRQDHLGQCIRVLGRWVRYFSAWRSHSQTTELRRLLNIEYSHVDLYRKGVESGCDWVIILEDDAFSPDSQGLAKGLAHLINGPESPKYINLTTSFSLREIGVQHLLSTVPGVIWAGSGKVSVLQSERPGTNTVCAIAFAAEFLEQVLTDFDSQPVEPVVPIDWKLNASLMRLWDQQLIGPGDCWFLEPGPITQLSMIQESTKK